jgi:hypothetical protein
MLDDLLDAAHDAGWTVTWNPTAPPVTAYRVVLHRRGQLPIARFGTTLDEAAASILASLRTPPVPNHGEEGAT